MLSSKTNEALAFFAGGLFALGNLLLLAGIALAFAARRPVARAPRLIFLAVFAGSALAFALGGYWNWAAPSRDEFARPQLAADVASALAPARHRLIAKAGASEALQPNLTLLWDVPTVTGYLSLVPSGLQPLLRLTPEGAVGPDVFAPETATVLDLVGAQRDQSPRGFGR